MRKIVAAVALRFLPIVFALMVASIFVEPLLRHRSILAFWCAVYLPLVVGEPVLMALGVAAAISLVRPQRVEHLGRHIAAAVLAISCSA